MDNVKPRIDLTITRFAYTPMGVFGTYTLKSGIQYFTVERPWLNNQSGISCIPSGIYRCIPHFFNRGNYAAIEITGVPNRSAILIHIANKAIELNGCIAPGKSLGVLDNMWAVTFSGLAFNDLMGVYGGKEFNLEIKQFREEA